MATLDVTTGRGLFASRPAAGHAGRTYYSTDTSVNYRDNGVSWDAQTTAGMSDPMTTRGDMIIRNASNVTARLARGAAGKVLMSDGTDIGWDDAPGVSEITGIPTAEMDSALVLAPDGSGGVEFRAESGGGGGGVTYPIDTFTPHASAYDTFEDAVLDTGVWTRRGYSTFQGGPHETLEDSYLKFVRREGTSFGYTMPWTPTTEAELQMAASFWVPGDEGFGLVILDSAGTGITLAHRASTMGFFPVTTFVPSASASAQGHVTIDGTKYLSAGRRVWLSIKKKGSVYFFRWSFDGVTWVQPMNGFIPSAFTPAMVGFMQGVQNASDNYRNYAVDWINVLNEASRGNNLMITPTSGTVTPTKSGPAFSGSAADVIDGNGTTNWIGQPDGSTPFWWNAAFSVDQTMNRLMLYTYESHDWGNGYVEFSSGTKIPFYASAAQSIVALDFPTEVTSFVKIWHQHQGQGTFSGLQEVEAYLAS